MKPILAASLSLVPGAGHLIIGERGKAAALFVIDIALICTVYAFNSPAIYLLIGFVYLVTMIPAVLEAYTLAQGGVCRFSESKPYVAVLLLVTGFAALPLLWQGSAFSRRSKIGWSISIFVLAIFYFSFLGVYGMQLFHYVNRQFV